MLCPDHKMDVISCAEKFCKVESKGESKTTSDFTKVADITSLKQYNGLCIDFCIIDKKGTCKGFLNEENAVLVNFEKKSNRHAGRVVKPKDLEHMKEVFPRTVHDVILQGKALEKFPRLKTNDLVYKALGKVAYVGKGGEAFTAFRTNHPNKKARVLDAVIRIHIHQRNSQTEP